MSQTYYTIDENHVNREEILDNLIYKLHDEEWPNDWRYSTIYFLLLDFVECEDRDEVEDRRFEIVDGLVDVYNADRVRWLGENLNRGLVGQIMLMVKKIYSSLLVWLNMKLLMRWHISY